MLPSLLRRDSQANRARLALRESKLHRSHNSLLRQRRPLPDKRFLLYQKSLVGGSGYYVAGCTASSGLCPSYPNRCTSQFLPDATWNSTSQLWQCCGVDENYNPACEDPTNEHFVAPAPGALQTFFSVPREGQTATSIMLEQQSSATRAAASSRTGVVGSAAVVSFSTTSAPSPPNATSPASSSSLQSGGLSTATKAGIGIGAALGALAAIGFLAYFIFRKRRERRALTGEDGKPSFMESSRMNSAELAEQNDLLPSELGDRDARKPVEMGLRDSVHELEARHRG